MTTEPVFDGPLAQALDDSLARRYAPPELPAGFRLRLDAAIARAPANRLTGMRALEDERDAALAALDAEYIRLRRRTLGTLVGAAFTTGVACALAAPWLAAHLGALSLVSLPAAGAVVGIWIGWHQWLRRA